MAVKSLISLLAILTVSLTPVVNAKTLTDGQIRQYLIQESIDNYPGNCPCPYNTARNGSNCGRRSAYSRGGGYAPLCYPKDISATDVNAYRKSHK